MFASQKQISKWMNCEQNLSESYKFFLSFENSKCEDYISGKYLVHILYVTEINPKPLQDIYHANNYEAIEEIKIGIL